MTTSKQDEELLEVIELGIETEFFVKSNLGRYLRNKAQVEAFDAMSALKVVLPTEAETIRELQNAIQQAENFEAWLAEAIQSGKNAEEQLELANATD